ncbi:MAG: maltotransferase domain-containing protein [Actinomycetota bacterium]
MARVKPADDPEDRGARAIPSLAQVLPPTVAPGASVGEGRRRAVIESVSPEIDGGRFPVKRVTGEGVTVEADVFADGHDELAVELRWRREDERRWRDAPMASLGNDRWRGSFAVEELGRYRYTVRAWVDRFASWHQGLLKKVEAGQDVRVDLQIGAELVEGALGRARGRDRQLLRQAAASMREGSVETVDPVLAAVMRRYPDRRFATQYDRELIVWVEPERARFSAWYELFPRSTGAGGRSGTLATTIERLPYVAGMGFDVLYLPPVHPIGTTHRKGRNNNPRAEAGAVGSPWAIGGPEGGHTAIHPDLGTLEDFDRLVTSTADHGLAVALDAAFQCSPDHPWVREHPDWFRHRPDGTIQYAENPPKKYEDIYPLDFETEDWRGLWAALRGVFEFWVGHGVRIFRVDNPHTKSLAFWEWCIDSLKREHPDLIFLSEAFTRPRLMERLAKLGFTQSYTYFAWRTQKQELIDYFSELTQTELREYLRPNLWPNTPDILTEQLQTGGRAAFMHRLVLAATLGASYGIYGPAFELMEHAPATPGKEEYLHSEKYEVRDWNLDDPRSLSKFVARINAIRREHPALQSNDGLRFHDVDNDNLIAYSKITPDREDTILTIVNLHPEARQSGTVHLWLYDIGVTEYDRPFQVHDLITDARYVWRGNDNYVELDPAKVPAHVFHVVPHVRDERDFETYR